MASKNHVVDTSVVERRLRPIYEWLDSGNPKRALQETDKVLKKTPNLQCAKALKALSLLQLGREVECVQILNNLTEESPSDNSTLQAMSICYRDLNQLDKVCTLYEKAVQIDNNNEELHTHLFMSYVRTNNFKMQQQTAMSLYKLKNKNPYYFWAIMSIVLQATRGVASSDINKKNVLLSLAERMINKFINENKIDAEQEIQLYMMILELQNKYSEALEVLNGPLGTKLLCSSTDLSRINYLTKLSRWQELSDFCSELLTANFDRWDIWNHYIAAMFHLVESVSQNDVTNHVKINDESESTSVDDLIEKIHEFISSMIENFSGENIFESGSGYALRGPYLARFELYKRLKLINYDAGKILGDVFELFIEYFHIFGHKSCVVSDLRIYLNLLTDERRLSLATRLLSDVNISAVTMATTERQMKRHINALQLSRLLGNHGNLDLDFKNKLILAFLLHFKNGSELFGLEKLSTDLGPADNYVILAVHLLFDVAREMKKSEPLILALSVLEKLLKSSPSNFHAKLLCVRLYHTLGAPLGAQIYYELLDTKHLQLDSLGFIHCGLLYPTGCFSLTTSIFDATLKFFSTNYRDSIDHLTFSYKFGSFLKLEEFMNFRERLNNSLHYTITAIDKMFLEIILCPNIKNLNISDAFSKNNNIDWDNLRDNNDYEVYFSWNTEDITDKKSEKNITLFEQDKNLAKIRSNLLYIVSISLELSKSTSENRSTTAKSLKTAYCDYENNYKQIQQMSISSNVENLSNPLPSRLQKQFEMPDLPLIGCLVQFLLHCCHDNDKKVIRNTQNENESCNVELFKKVLKEIVERIKNIIQRQNEAVDVLWEKRNCLETIVNSVEMLSVCTVLCGTCYELVRPAQSASAGKRNRKKAHQNLKGPQNGSTHSQTIREDLNSYISTLQQSCSEVEQILDTWKFNGPPKDFCEQFGALDINSSDVWAPEMRESVLKRVEYSHSMAVSEMRSSLLLKTKYLNTLNC